MKYSDWNSFEKHLQNAAPSHLSSVYLLLGKEEFFRLLAEEALFSLARDSGRKIIRWECYLGIEKLLEQELLTLDLFAASKLIYLSVVDKLSKQGTEILQKYYLRPQKEITLILSAPSLNANTNFYKNTEKNGVVFSPEVLRPKDEAAFCSQWLIKQAAKEKKTLMPAGAELLYQYIGFDYISLKNELEKLVLFVGDANTISESDTAELVSAIPQASSWQVSEAILQGNLPQALHLSHKILQGGTSLIGFIRQIRRSIQTGFEINALASRGADSQEFTRRFPYMKGFILDKNIQLARQYGTKRFQNALVALDRSEFSAKDSNSDDELLLDILVTTLILNMQISPQKNNYGKNTS